MIIGSPLPSQFKTSLKIEEGEGGGEYYWQKNQLFF